MKVLYVYSGGRELKKALLESHQAPSEFYYGYWELKQAGVEVDFIDVPEKTVATITSRFLNFFYYRWQILPCRATGDLLVLLHRLISSLNVYDVVVATTTGIGFCLEILRFLRLLRRPVVTIHCGILNYVYNRPTEMVTTYLLQRSHSQVFGVGEFEGMQRCYGLDETQIALNEFGVDTRFWCPDFLTKRKRYILSVGNCGRRDYDLLMRVAQEMAVPFKVVTDTAPHYVPNNVQILHGRLHADYEIPDRELRELYRQASVVVVPLVDSLQPSGQSVALQAMACGTPVVLTETAGIWNRNLLRDDYNCCLIRPGDVGHAKSKLSLLVENPDISQAFVEPALKTVRDHWDIRYFSKKVYELCLSVS